jgi:regulator of sirC expression with transglutaminase-like and TPR domain
VHYNLATALLAERRWSEAAAAFERTLVLDPRHVEAHFNLAVALHQLGDDGRAKEHLRAFVRLYPHDDARRRRAMRLAAS